MTKKDYDTTYIEDIKMEVLDIASSNEELILDSDKTLLLVVDMVNDSHRNDGFLAKGGNDISMGLSVESTAIDLINQCKTVGLPVAYVKPIYDFKYLYKPMKDQLKMAGIPDMLFKKGQWGSEFIDTLPEPDLCLTKSHFSSFTPYSFMFSYDSNLEAREYVNLPGSKDVDLRNEGKKVMDDFFQEAEKNDDIINKANIDSILENEVVSLHGYLQAKGIDTLIIIGGSTHVCVDAAIAGATERGYRIVLPVDTISSEDHGKHWTYLHNFSAFKGFVTKSDKIKIVEKVQI